MVKDSLACNHQEKDEAELTDRLIAETPSPPSPPADNINIMTSDDTAMPGPTGSFRNVLDDERADSAIYDDDDEDNRKRIVSWRELQSIESRRRAILKRSELPFYKILSFWDGTCLKAIGTAPLLWITLTIYVVCRIQIRLGENIPGFMKDLGDTDLGKNDQFSVG